MNTHLPADQLLLRDVTGKIIGVFYDVYNELGTGFPEFVLRRAMSIALTEAGLTVYEEKDLPVWFRGNRIVSFRADLIVDPGVIVEVKTSVKIQNFQIAQLKNYLRASDAEVGLLVNFGERPEFQRVVFENARKQPRRQVPPDDSEAGRSGTPLPPRLN